MKNGNGLYLEMKAIAGTMPHIKSEPRIHKVVPKLANTPRWVFHTKGVLIDATGTVLTYPGNKTLIAQNQNVRNGNSLPL